MHNKVPRTLKIRALKTPENGTHEWDTETSSWNSRVRELNGIIFTIALAPHSNGDQTFDNIERKKYQMNSNKPTK